MGYRAYPQYRDSGVEWFGRVPSHWQESRLKWTTESLKNGVWGSEPGGDDDDLYCIRVADFDRTRLAITPDNLTLRSIPGKDRAGRLLSRGDLLIEKSGGGDKQLVGVVVEYTLDEPAVCSNFIGALATAPRMHNRYLAYLHAHLYHTRVNYRSIKQSTGIQNLDAQAYFDELVFYPDVEEQERIAGFIDHKAAQIDRLIEKKQALLEKLEEQRISAITQAVTGGLDDSAPMQDSGIEWLGKIPAHWKTVAARHLIAKIEQGWSPLCEGRPAAPDEWAVLKSGCVNGGIFKESEQKALPSDLSAPRELEVKPGDILMCRASGSRHLIGSVARVESCREKMIFSDKTYRIVLEESLIAPEFFTLSMLAKYMREQIELSISGAEGLANNIPQSLVKSYLFVLPGIEEQLLIAGKLKNIAMKKEQQKLAVTAAIDLLQEYRTALITAAVTGQIDVRDWQAPAATPVPATDMEVA